MTDKNYYRITTWTSLVVIGLGLIEVTCWAFGLLPNWRWSNLDTPLFALNMLVMVRMMKWKDETIQDQEETIKRLRK